MIPKKLHIIWVGDESKRPDNCINTWIAKNPGWSVRIWGNEDLVTTQWINAGHMREMSKKELNGVADLMKWEILYFEGGFVVDADSICIRPLEDWLLDAEAFACWENEIDRPKLIAAGYVASVPENPFFGQIIQDIKAEKSVVHDMAWKTVGPLRLSTAFHEHRYANLTIWPSHFFIPEHFAGQVYGGGGHIFARQEWASTRGTYDTLHLKEIACT